MRVFALCVCDAQLVFSLLAKSDAGDAYSRANPMSNSHRFFGSTLDKPRVGIPRSDQLDFFGEESGRQLFDRAISNWQSLGDEVVEVDVENGFVVENQKNY